MPISQSLQCAFVHIPRTGGTSIEIALDMFGSPEAEDADMMFGPIFSPHLRGDVTASRYLQHLTAERMHRLAPEVDDYFRFSIVRNPWDRMVSVYCYGTRAYGYSFDEFLEWTNGSRHAWCLPQSRYLLDAQDNVLVDFVGRFENLAGDFRHVCERLGIERRLKHRNDVPHGHYRGYYDDDSRAIVARRYREDIERFGYEF